MNFISSVGFMAISTAIAMAFLNIALWADASRKQLLHKFCSGLVLLFALCGLPVFAVVSLLSKYPTKLEVEEAVLKERGKMKQSYEDAINQAMFYKDISVPEREEMFMIAEAELKKNREI